MARFLPVEGLSSSIAGRGTMMQSRGGMRAYGVKGFEMRVTLQYRTPTQTPQRLVNKWVKEVNKQMLEYWHSEFLPLHFRNRAMSQYNYQTRAIATLVRKREEFGHTKPIVKRGYTEIMLSRIRKLSATSRTATLIMRGPKYVGYRNKSRKTGRLSPDLPKEIKTITPGEAKKMAFAGSRILEQMKRDWSVKTAHSKP